MISWRPLLVVHQLASFFSVQLDILFGYVLGLACRPADMVYCPGLVAFAEGLQFWGIGVASFVFPGSLCLLFWFLGNSIQCDLLVTRLGLMPCSA